MHLSLYSLVCIVALTQAVPDLTQLCREIPNTPGSRVATWQQVAGCNPDLTTGGSQDQGSGDSSGSSSVTASAPANTNTSPPANEGSPSGESSTNIPSSNDTTTQPNNSTTTTTTTTNQPQNASIPITGASTNFGSIGKEYKSTVTRYGQGPRDKISGTDSDCQGHEGSCGNNPKSGWTAAASQLLYCHGGQSKTGEMLGNKGAKGGGNGGSACGTCWRVTGATDSSGASLGTTPIVVLITNECASSSGGDCSLIGSLDNSANLCSQNTFSQANALGGNVNIDLCMDSGAAGGFFGPLGPSDPGTKWGTAVGTAQQVDCDEWCGTFADGTKSGPAGCSAPGINYPIVT